MEFFMTGLLLGLSAGVSPGPLFALVISETLQGNTIDGIKVAVSPLITDAPIILFCFLVLDRIKNLPFVLGTISFLGGAYVMYLGISSLRTRVSVSLSVDRSSALCRGILTNAASPHPYLFWVSVGTPVMGSAMLSGPIHVVLFLAAFYFCLVGAKIALAFISGQSKHLLSSRLIVLLNRIMGILLLVFSLLLFRKAIQLLFQN